MVMVMVMVMETVVGTLLCWGVKLYILVNGGRLWEFAAARNRKEGELPGQRTDAG